MDKITEQIIAAAIEVHKTLGPGLLESAYEECLAREFELRNIPFARQVPLSIEYKGTSVDFAYRMDMVVDDSVVLELKTADALTPIHQVQLLTYLKLSGKSLGLLINFHVPLLKDGIKRIVNHYKNISATSASLR